MTNREVGPGHLTRFCDQCFPLQRTFPMCVHCRLASPDRRDTSACYGLFLDMEYPTILDTRISPVLPPEAEPNPL